jgi:hypothetical protein
MRTLYGSCWRVALTERLIHELKPAGLTVAWIEPEHARIADPSFVMDGDHIVVDGPAPLEQLVMAPALIHLAGHAEQLKLYAR